LVPVNDIVVRVQAQLAATVLAAMVLFASVDMTVFLALMGCTLWTRVSDDHGFLLTSLVQVGILTNHTMGL
jgi:hypothetical protein